MNTINWSSSEKKIAKQAFDVALKREYAALLDQLKSTAAKADSQDDIWDIHDYLTEQRILINQKYDYRYSQLMLLFGVLLRDKWLEEKDIAGLAEEKLEEVRRIACLLSRE
jgi:Photoprotection regulator fluorescence recovery protein